MNLLLLAPEDVRADSAVISGPRAHHVFHVLKKKKDDQIRVGVLGIGRGNARIAQLTSDKLALDTFNLSSVSPPTTSLTLAIPRPKGLSRIIQAAASFGLKRIDLVGAWKVDPAYFDSPRLLPDRLKEDLLLGMAQGGQVFLPEISIERRFVHYVEEVLPARPAFQVSERRVLTPGAQALLRGLNGRGVWLAIGPDGGYIDSEVASLDRAGFVPTRLGPSILRTEVAVAAALGQVDLEREYVQAELESV